MPRPIPTRRSPSVAEGLLPPPVTPPVAPRILFTLPGASPASRDLTITRMAHASVLISWGDEVLLTDPWFSEKGGFPGYYMGESLPMPLGELPPLTGVLASMDHYDHFDIETFAGYRDHAVPIVIPAGTPQGAAARKAGFTDVRALSPWEATQLGSFRVTAVSTKPDLPAAHFEYEHAYIVEAGGHTVLFCAHTMTPDVQGAIAARFPHIEVAILAVNGLCLRMMHNHQLSLGPDDAARMLGRLGAGIAIPIHYAFHGGLASNAVLLSHRGTPQGLTDAVREQAPDTTVLTLAPGQRLDVTRGRGGRVEDAREEKHREALLTFFERIDAHDPGAFDLFAPEFVHHQPLPTAPDATREGARIGMTRLQQEIPGFRVRVERLVVEGDAALVRIVHSTRDDRTASTTMLYRFTGDQIAEEWIEGAPG